MKIPQIMALAVAVLATVIYLCLPIGHLETHNPRAVVIDVWHSWGGYIGDDFQATVRQFNQTHPGIFVRTLFAPNDLANSTKFFISIAGGVPPDLAFVDGPQVAAWAEMGILEPLDDFFTRARITEDDFWPPCWRQCRYRDHNWAITFVADPNFALVWNKGLFREVGLDPEKPPETIEEVNQFCERLTKFDAQGNMIRIGMMPWATYGGANSIFTWGWVFGGDFFDYGRNRITADEPRNVAALRWMTSVATKFGLSKVNALNATFGSGPQDPFLTGKIAMQAMHVTSVLQVPRYAPDLDIGVGPLPAPPDGEKDSSWVGGWTMAIPRDARQARPPQRREAIYTFLKWMCASPEGTAIVAKNLSLFPGYRKCPYFDELRSVPLSVDDHRPGTADLRKNRIMRPYLEILEKCKHQRPVTPAQARYMFELERAASRVLYGQATAEQALAEARVNTQEALDRITGHGAGEAHRPAHPAHNEDGKPESGR